MPKLNKLLANLPFNPSLIGQVSFYSKRLKKETSIRRLGFVMLMLAMLIQLFAAMSPPKPSLASSNNDLVYGGFGNLDQAVLHCLNGNEDYYKILRYYNIGCDNVHAAVETWIGPNDFGGQLYSMGRLPYNLPGEQPVNIPGANNDNPLYLRFLWGWGKNAPPYHALEGKSATGLPFFLLFDCGNIVFVGLPPATPPPVTPPVIPPPVPPPVTPPVLPKVISCSALFMNVADNASLKLGSTVAVRGQAAGQNIPAGQKVDMQYDLVDNATSKVIANARSPGVPFNGAVANDTKTHRFKITKSSDYLIRLTVTYGINKVASGSASGDCLKHITVQKPCEEVVSQKDLGLCLKPHKTAQNLTQHLANANGTVARAGDIIEYSLSVTNTGNVKVKKFIFRESISDVLDYTDVVDLRGGSLDKYKIVSWPAVTVKGHETVKRLITVKVKSPIPQTPTSASDPGHFDCVMTNVYGDVVSIKLSRNAICVVQKVNTSLPNTGPGASLIAIVSLTVVAGYFFARSRLISEEVDIVRQDYASTGGL